MDGDRIDGVKMMQDAFQKANAENVVAPRAFDEDAKKSVYKIAELWVSWLHDDHMNITQSDGTIISVVDFVELATKFMLDDANVGALGKLRFVTDNRGWSNAKGLYGLETSRRNSCKLFKWVLHGIGLVCHKQASAAGAAAAALPTAVVAGAAAGAGAPTAVVAGAAGAAGAGAPTAVVAGAAGGVKRPRNVNARSIRAWDDLKKGINFIRDEMNDMEMTDEELENHPQYNKYLDLMQNLKSWKKIQTDVMRFTEDV